MAVKAYPNPTQGSIRFDWAAKQTLVQIELYDILGNLLKTEQVHHESTYHTSLKGRPAGMYIFCLKNEQGEILNVQKIELTE
jgi:hypothetical protein